MCREKRCVRSSQLPKAPHQHDQLVILSLTTILIVIFIPRLILARLQGKAVCKQFPRFRTNMIILSLTTILIIIIILFLSLILA